MKTRIKDLPAGFSFEYTEFKRPLPQQWHFVGGEAAPATWPSAWKRDQARGCFTHRHSVGAALDDLKRQRLLP
jgi:hypothetical protein